MSGPSSPAMNNSPPSPPSPRLKVKLGDEERTLFMSFGLQGELARLIGGPENVPALSFDPVQGIAAIELILLPRDRRGNIVPSTVDNISEIVAYHLPVDVAEEIIDWASEHLLDFFVRRFASGVKMFATRAPMLGETASSLTSSGS